MEIGFVLKYNEKTGRGIIVFGHSGPFRRPPEPVVYLRDEYTEEVSPGMLVYFDYTINNRNERLATNIEIASLCNFKRDIVIRTFSQNRYIEYTLRNRDIERLLDGPMQESACYDELWDIDTNDDVFEDLNLLDLENDTISDVTPPLPAIIENTWDGSYYINISNLSLWLNESLACKESCYGKTTAEFLDIVDLFSDKSDSLKYLLPDFSHDELTSLLKRYPSLQRVFPESFYTKSPNLLSDQYGFPSVGICELYYSRRVHNIGTTEEYCFLKSLFERSINPVSNSNSLITIASLDTSSLCKLLADLEKCYSERLLEKIRDRFVELCSNKQDGEVRFNALINNNESAYLIDLGLFIDYVPDKESGWDIGFGQILHLLGKLQEEDKELLTLSIRKIANNCLLCIANDPSSAGKPSQIHYFIDDYCDYLDMSAVKTICDSLNNEFANCEDLDDLVEAFSYGYITVEQYSNRFQILTKEYSWRELQSFVEHADEDAVKSIQVFLIQEIISRNPDSYYGSYSESLFEWFDDQCRIGHRFDSIVLMDVLQKAIDKYNDDNWLSLFDKGIITFLPSSIIRSILDEAYENNYLSSTYSYEACFQKIMMADALKETTASEKLFFILENLNSDNCYKLFNKEEGPISFFAWAYLDAEDLIHVNVDWNALPQYFPLLPQNQQIRIFKYLVYLKAIGEEDYSLQELASKLTDGTNPICSSLLALIALLSKLCVSLSCEISISDLKPFFICKSGLDSTSLHAFTRLFWACRGRRLYLDSNKPAMEPTGYITKKEKDGSLYYVVTFYEDPDKELLDNYIGFCESAERKLRRNFTFSCHNGSYWISSNETIRIKSFAKQFFLKDRCGLFNYKYEVGDLHMNALSEMIDHPKVFCDCNICLNVDPRFGLPFYWCQKQPCVHKWGRFFTYEDDWEYYRFADLLSALYDYNHSYDDRIWDIESKIARIMNGFVSISFINRKIAFELKTEKIEEEMNGDNGQWTETMSILLEQENDYEDDDSDEEEACNEENPEIYDESPERENRPTYNKYNGYYAQDEAGYSDDDIDTIFDGDPSAYWNID